MCARGQGSGTHQNSNEFTLTLILPTPWDVLMIKLGNVGKVTGM